MARARGRNRGDGSAGDEDVLGFVALWSDERPQIPLDP